jgi:hypothetical protein
MPTISKGSVLKIDVATVLTAVSEVISIDHDGAENETFKYSTLDQSGAGHLYLSSGYTEPGNVNTELMFLPTNSGHQQVTDHLTTPSTTAATQLDGEITFADGSSTTMPFKIAGFSFGVSIAMDDGVKASVGMKVSGVPTYAT